LASGIANPNDEIHEPEAESTGLRIRSWSSADKINIIEETAVASQSNVKIVIRGEGDFYGDQ
jgi:hypothetical protein